MSRLPRPWSRPALLRRLKGRPVRAFAQVAQEFGQVVARFAAVRPTAAQSELVQAANLHRMPRQRLRLPGGETLTIQSSNPPKISSDAPELAPNHAWYRSSSCLNSCETLEHTAIVAAGCSSVRMLV